jgi:hypothetical protein
MRADGAGTRTGTGVGEWGGWHSSLGGVGTSFTGLRSLAAEASGEGEVGGGLVVPGSLRAVRVPHEHRVLPAARAAVAWLR